MTSIISYLQTASTAPYTEVVVPNGTYTAGTATGGALVHTNWLFVTAATQGGVTIDDTSGTKLLLTGASKICFVGFNFHELTVQLQGCTDVVFWYPDSTFPEAAGTGLDTASTYRWFINGGTHCSRIKVLGGNIHDVGDDAIQMNAADDCAVLGTTLARVADPVEHSDGIQTTGAVANLEVGWCDFGANFQIGGEFGAVSGINLHDSWWHNSQTANGVIFNHYGPYATLTGTIKNVYDYNAHHRYDYHAASYGGTNTQYPAGSIPAWVNVTETNVIQSAPPAGTANPATSWQATYPYPSYISYVTGGQAAPNPDLQRATNATGSSLSPLNAQTVTGNIYVVVSPASGVASAAFTVDGVAARTEASPPLSLGGDNGAGALLPYDTSSLVSGNHVIAAHLVFNDSTTSDLTATVNVTGGVSLPPSSTGGTSTATNASALIDNGVNYSVLV